MFEKTYRELYGNRWDSLKSALLEPRNPIPFTDGLVQPYFLDEASLIAASALPVQKGDHILDMCAAPGGKSLVLASKLGGTGTIVCNDRSPQRRARLACVIKTHLPQQWQNTITITGHDASSWGIHEKEAYDKVLLDAPCSSERHVLVDQKALFQWSPARPRHLSIQQFAMLCAALEAVKVGGCILYSTCAIHPEENEKVIQKLEKKRSGRFEVIPLSSPLAEPRSFGQIILPDSSQGKGPLYFCLIRRKA